MAEEKKTCIKYIWLKKSIFYISVIFIFAGFNFQDKQTGWFVQYAPTGGRTINDIKFLDTLVGYAVTNRGTNNDTSYILATTNGGTNWLISYRFYGEFFSISIPVEGIVYVAGGRSGTGEGALYKSTNLGITWENSNPTSGMPPFAECFFVNLNTGWVCANDNTFGGIWRTLNGGMNWQMQAGGMINNIYFIDAYTGYYVQYENIFKTTNAGNNWISKGILSGPARDIFFNNSDTGWAIVSDNLNYIYKTTNSGSNWIYQNSPLNESESSTKIFFLNKNTGWIGNIFYPRILVTKDGGVSWGKLMQMPSNSIPSSVQFLDTIQGWAGGGFSIIHSNDGGGIISNNNENINIVSNEYVLYQNYPNPFNAVTKIKYKISRHGGSSTYYIKIKVFDIEGKEIRVLVDKKQAAGTYEINFNGSSLPSGVYFYKLETDGFSDTKKMILIK